MFTSTMSHFLAPQNKDLRLRRWPHREHVTHAVTGLFHTSVLLFIHKVRLGNLCYDVALGCLDLGEPLRLVFLEIPSNLW